VEAALGWIDPQTAIFESASACGLALLTLEKRDRLRATSRGVGELLFEAVDRGAQTVIVGLGGTATVDGGTGAARGLGWTFADAVAKADLVLTGEGMFDRTSLVGKAAGEAMRRAQAARKKVVVVAARAEPFAGLHIVSGAGQTLDARAIAALGERAAREAFGLPAA